MALWLVALAVGAAFAALQYLRIVARQGTAGAVLAGLRALAVTLLVALIADAPAGRERVPAPIVALDASLSWTRGGGTRWAAAVERARALAGDSVLLVGDSTRLFVGAATPADHASSLRPIAEQAISQGRPLILVTDGELHEAAVADALPRGSRLLVLPATAAVDRALAAFDAPRVAATGDTVRLALTVRSGGAPTPGTEVRVALGGAEVARVEVPPLRAREVRELRVAFPVRAPEGTHLLVAALAGGDVEARNDTLAAALEVSRAAGAVWISGAPDLDGREALGVLRGALSVPTRAYLRVAPGAWRVDGTLEPIAESAVRAAAREAPILVVHGDTAVFGAPRALAPEAPLALLPGPTPPPAGADPVLDEWYATVAPPSPAAAALGGIPWDSLTPVSLGAAAALPVPEGQGTWVALAGQRARRGEVRPFVVGAESPRRVLVARATGFWRWRTRGGAGATAYQALWGSLFDWLAGGRRDRRAAVPERAARAGEPIRWRVASGDSVVVLRLARRDGPARVDSILLRPVRGSIFAESSPLPAGVYDVEAPGGTSLLVVNASRELVPAAPTVAEGERGRGAVAATRASLRDHGLAYAALIALLCAEWVLRRRRGLR